MAAASEPQRACCSACRLISAYSDACPYSGKPKVPNNAATATPLRFMTAPETRADQFAAQSMQAPEGRLARRQNANGRSQCLAQTVADSRLGNDKTRCGGVVAEFLP